MMKTKGLLFVLAMASPLCAHAQIAAPQIVGPAYPVVQQRSEYQHRENVYCGGYFVLEAKTQYGGPYLAFYYRDENNAVASDEVPLNDVSLAIVPDPTSGTSLPKVVLVGQDGGQKVWVVGVTEKMRQDYMPCLKDVPLQSKP